VRSPSLCTFQRGDERIEFGARNKAPDVTLPDLSGLYVVDRRNERLRVEHVKKNVFKFVVGYCLRRPLNPRKTFH